MQAVNRIVGIVRPILNNIMAYGKYIMKAKVLVLNLLTIPWVRQQVRTGLSYVARRLTGKPLASECNHSSTFLAAERLAHTINNARTVKGNGSSN